MGEFQAIGATGIILDANNGEVLALESLPDFDPNAPASSDTEARFNRATLGVYEMGSTFKIFNTAMALDYGTTTLAGGYDASKPIQVARFTITDYKGQKRWLTVPEIFMYSSNIGSVRMALDVGRDRQREFLGRFGFLKAPSIELPEVGGPLLPAPWREITQPMSPGRWLRSRKPGGFCGGGSRVCSIAIIACTTVARSAASRPASSRATSSRERLSSSVDALRPLAVSESS